MPAKLASFGAEVVAEEGLSGEKVSSAKITPYGVTTNSATGGNHGRDAHAMETLHASPFTLHERSCETNPI